MFNQSQPRRLPGAMHNAPIQSQCEQQAKERLAHFVYEYMLLSGAQKSAETFKEEVISNLPMSTATPSQFKVGETPPGFLASWWMIFWDLYCAAPERRDQIEPSQDGKMFYDTFIQGNYSNPMMNGMPHVMFHGPGNMITGPDGMMAFPGRFPPGRGPPGPGGIPGYVFPGGAGDPRAITGQRMPAGSMRMQNSQFGHTSGMRPNPAAPQGMAYRGPPSFMDSPGQAFPPGSMLPNGMGPQPPMSMSSPGMQPSAPDGSHPAYLMGMPASSSAMTFGISDTNMGNGVSSGPLESTNQSMILMNGGEDLTVKQSPSSTPRGLNGGTPGAPGSAQSAVPSSGTPMGAGSTDEKPGSNSKPEDIDDISKIKQGLLDDFTPKDEPSDPSYMQYN